ncbi:MAG: AMP-binding protein [Myxococcota bacterium]
MGLSMEPERARNIASLVLRHADTLPDATALVLPMLGATGEHLGDVRVTFEELARRVNAYRRGLVAEGFVPGDRIVMMFPVSVELYALTLAMFAQGLVAVLVDTGMGPVRVVQALEDARARALVTVPALVRSRWVLPPLWRFRIYVTGKRRTPEPRTRPVSQLERSGSAPPPPQDVRGGEHALITFTSGATGRPQGAGRTHSLLIAQHRALADQFPNRPGAVEATCFPAVALHNLCSGIPTVLAAVDLRKPASLEPTQVVRQLTREGATRLTAAPAFASKLVDHILAQDARIPSLEFVGVGGGPVPPELCSRILRALPGVHAEVLYACAEAEPISSVPMREVVEAQGAGLLVGRAASAATIALVDLPERSPPMDQRGLTPYEVERGAIGEVVVAGDHVHRGYIDNPEANRRSKLYEPRGRVWHRTGDMGYVDDEGRLWLVGRVQDVVRHRGRTLYPLALERHLDEIPGIERAAIVQRVHIHQGLVVVQLAPGVGLEEVRWRIEGALEVRGYDPAMDLRAVPEIPLDRRHKAKIDRVTLRLWFSVMW